MAHVLERSGRERIQLVPAEITAAIGMILLRDNGVVTVNTHGAPGGRVSLRLKPTAGALAAVTDASGLVAALDRAVDQVIEHLDDPGWLETTLFGETT